MLTQIAMLGQLRIPASYTNLFIEATIMEIWKFNEALRETEALCGESWRASNRAQSLRDDLIIML
jgi:hypothetical protein